MVSLLEGEQDGKVGIKHVWKKMTGMFWMGPERGILFLMANQGHCQLGGSREAVRGVPPASG